MMFAITNVALHAIILVNGKIDQTEGAPEKCPDKDHEVYRGQGRQVE